MPRSCIHGYPVHLTSRVTIPPYAIPATTSSPISATAQSSELPTSTVFSPTDPVSTASATSQRSPGHRPSSGAIGGIVGGVLGGVLVLSVGLLIFAHQRRNPQLVRHDSGIRGSGNLGDKFRGDVPRIQATPNEIPSGALRYENS